MKHRHASNFRGLSSATPALASVVAAAAYGLGALVFSFASQSGTAELPDRVLRYDAPGLNPERPAIVMAQAEEAPQFTETVVLPPARRIEAVGQAEPVSVVPERPRLAIVLDDVGLDLTAAERAAAIDVPMTLAILPYADRSARAAQLAISAGHDVLVHMPMEPLGLADPGPFALRVDQEERDMRNRVRWAMQRVPGAVGLNNHMGSRFTQDPGALRIALSELVEPELLFLDSITTAGSRGAAVARGLGLSVLERDIFLDHVIDRDVIETRLDEALALAELRGWAIVIGHPHADTLAALEAFSASDAARGLDFVTISDLSRFLSESDPEIIEASAR